MRTGIVVAVCVVLAACGGSDPEDCGSITPSGTYKAHYVEKSGTCNTDIPDSLVSLDSLDTSEPGCTVFSSSVSAGECRGDIDQECAYPADNLRQRQTGYLEIQDDKGEEITGTITFVIRRLDNNNAVCTSTYEITLTKQ